MQLAAALDYIHGSAVAHRDMKWVLAARALLAARVACQGTVL